MSSQNEPFFDLISKLPEWTATEVEENLAHTLSVLLISFTCRAGTRTCWNFGVRDFSFISVLLYATLTEITEYWNVQIKRHCHCRLCKPFWANVCRVSLWMMLKKNYFDMSFRQQDYYLTR